MCVPVYLYLYAPHSHFFDLKDACLAHTAGLCEVFAKDGRLYTKHTNHSEARQDGEIVNPFGAMASVSGDWSGPWTGWSGPAPV